MDSSQLSEMMKYEKKFHGVFARDCLNFNIEDKPIGIIVNTDDKSEKGEHWVAIYINEYKRGEYFDSFGLPPLHKDFSSFLNKNCAQGWLFNSCTIQHFKSTKCGKFCIAFLKARFRGQSFENFISQFSVNLAKNDLLVDNLICQ